MIVVKSLENNDKVGKKDWSQQVMKFDCRVFLSYTGEVQRIYNTHLMGRLFYKTDILIRVFEENICCLQEF